MTRESFQTELEDLQADVVDMGDAVLDQLDDALQALTTGDEPLGQTVVAGDTHINDAYLDVEAECIDLFALQQPVASDLRIVAASYKIATDVERVGDLATNLGAYATAAETDRFPDVDVSHIGAEARDLFADALTAYASEDVEACKRIAERDDALDTHCHRASEQVVRDLIETGDQDVWDVERVLDDVSRLMLTVRDLERVGDHAVNIAARTLYMATNDPTLIY
jgi:phosphate transport system protein